MNVEIKLQQIDEKLASLVSNISNMYDSKELLAKFNLIMIDNLKIKEENIVLHP